MLVYLGSFYEQSLPLSSQENLTGWGYNCNFKSNIIQQKKLFLIGRQDGCAAIIQDPRLNESDPAAVRGYLKRQSP